MSRQDKHKIAAALRAVTHKSKILSRKPLMLLPAAATLGILALVSVLFTSADTASNTYAANLGSQITTEVDGQYYVTLTAPDVNFSVSPSKNENAAKQRIDVGVETNVAGGAKLYLSMAGSSNSLHLNGNTAQASPAIAAVPDNTDASSFPANTWGYSTDDQTYSAVPTTASDPALLANIDGETTGTTSGSVISANIPVYYAANVDTSIPSGSYSNRMTYSAVVDGGITAEATLTSIKVDGQEVSELQGGKANTILVTTNLMAQPYGTPRVYYRTTNPAGYAECGDVVASSNESGYMTVQCTTTPNQAATGVTLYIVPKGSENDEFCIDGTYPTGSSQCEMGEWKWGEFGVELPNIVMTGFDGILPPTNFSDIQYMQHMTPEICASASINDTKRLIDYRDGKYYWVAKLADGNCWMTQNLDLDLKFDIPLTPELSDVSASWRPIDTIDDNGRASDIGAAGEGNNAIQSWELGDWAMRNIYGSNRSFSSSGDISSASTGLRDVSNLTPMTTYRSDNVIISGSAYDAHYHIGNYYSYVAATAGSGANAVEDGDRASDSICPKGWELPVGGNTDGSNNNIAGSFYNLLNQYGLTASGNNAYMVAAAPLFFARAGMTSPGWMHNLNNYGIYWSSVTASTSTAYTMSFYNGLNNGQRYIEPNDSLGRYYAVSVRCVAASS